MIFMKFYYTTKTDGLGGRIKQITSDFIVSEIGADYRTSVKYLPDKRIEELDWQKIFSEKENYEQLLLDMEKNNLSTTSAISQLSRFLRVSKKRVGYAGLKDKRAITSQRVSVFEPTLERLSKFYFKNIKVYNPQWSSKRIDIGDLKQNEFIVTIRQITGKSKDDIKEAIDSCIFQIVNKGLLNYFGEQRFGGLREVTHVVGKHLLRKDYRSAVMAYLTQESPGEDELLAIARKELSEDLNFGKHASNFPDKSGYESIMLNHLAKNPDDFLGAIKALPKSIQYLFIHAYQAYLFNELINLRFENGFGVEAIEGDVVRDGSVLLPLFGFQSSFSEGKAGELERHLLESEGVSFSDFYNQEYSVLSSK